MMAECYGESGCRTKEMAFCSLVDTLARRRKVDRSYQLNNNVMTQRESTRKGLGCGSDLAVPVKGLLNKSGENSCFLNSTIQVLWHVDVFRDNFRLLSAHACTENSCIFCAIKVLFTQFQYSDHETIPSDCLRKALAETFQASGRFQVGLMDDAAECFEKILLGLHWHLTDDQPDDQCTAGHCITHRKFTMYVIEQVGCLGNTLSRRRTLMNYPDVMNIGLVWDSERADMRHIRSVMETVEMEMDARDIFYSRDGALSIPSKYRLAAIVCYHHRHYCTLVHHVNGDVWTCLDDASIKQIGSGWSAVIEKICSGKYQPLLLVYVKQNGCRPITMQTAPSQTVFVSNLQQFQRTLGLDVRHKPTDYDGGGSLAMETLTTMAHIFPGFPHAADRSQTLPFSVDVDACLQPLTSPRSSTLTREVTIAGSSSPALTVPDWLTSTDDLTSLTGATRYINPSTVKSVLRLRGIERLEATAGVDDATYKRRARHIGRQTTYDCVDHKVIDHVENRLQCSSSVWTTEGSAAVDTVDRQLSTREEQQPTVSCVSDITTRVREIAIASRSECYYGLRCLPYDTAKTPSCWPRRLQNETPQTQPILSLIPSSFAVNIPPTDVVLGGSTSKEKKKARKRVTFADRMTTIVIYSDEIPSTCDAGSPCVSATFTGSLSASLSGAPQRCELVDDKSLNPDLVTVVSSTSEDDVDSLDVNAEDDEGFVDENGITSSVSRHGAKLSTVPQHVDLIRCGLCQRRWVFPPAGYCVVCETYFARLASA